MQRIRLLALVVGAQSLGVTPSRRPRTIIRAEPPNVPQDLPFDIQRRVDEARRRQTERQTEDTQRKRMRKWTVDGDRRPREDRGPDMRLWVPMWAYTGLLTTLLVYAARVTFNPYTAFRMDMYGDGECGSNSTQFAQNGGCLSGVTSFSMTLEKKPSELICG